MQMFPENDPNLLPFSEIWVKQKLLFIHLANSINWIKIGINKNQEPKTAQSVFSEVLVYKLFPTQPYPIICFKHIHLKYSTSIFFLFL